MKKYLWMSSVAVMIGALRVNVEQFDCVNFKCVWDMIILLAIWMDGRKLKFTSLSTALLSYQDKLISCVLLNPAYSVKNSGDGISTWYNSTVNQCLLRPFLVFMIITDCAKW